MGVFRLMLVVWRTLLGSFGHPGCLFGSNGGLLVPFLASFWTSWGHVGRHWGDLGRPRGPKSKNRPGSPRNEPFWGIILGRFWVVKTTQTNDLNKCAKNNKIYCIATRSATTKSWVGSVFCGCVCSLRWMITVIVFSIFLIFLIRGCQYLIRKPK